MDLTAWGDAQRSVIGALLIAPEKTAGEIFQSARPVHFGDPAVRHLFETAQQIWTENRPIDAVTLLAAAGEDYRELIVKCMTETPTLANLSAWLELCRSSARLNALQGEAMAIVSASQEAEAVKAWERMGSMLQDADDGEDLSLGELIGNYLDRMQDKRPIRYLNWGIEPLDERLYVSGGQFGVIAADSSVGKTALALQFAFHMAEQGHRVGFFSLETPQENLADRLMAEKQVASVPLPSSKRKSLSESDYRRVTEAAMKSDTVNLRILRNYETLERIRAKTIQRRFDVIFIDYVQLIDAPGRERWDIVTNISMGLHRMAQQLGVTVVGLSQITPAAKGAKTAPTKDDLRESRQLKQDADFILLLYPDKEPGAAETARVLEIAKNKDGRLGRLRLDFDPEHMTFAYHLKDMNDMRSEGRVAKALRRAKKEPPPSPFVELPEVEGQEELPF